jgi:hypothetical protein
MFESVYFFLNNLVQYTVSVKSQSGYAANVGAIEEVWNALSMAHTS